MKDPLAWSLRRAGTSTIGVVVPRLTDVVMAIVYEEIAAADRLKPFSVVATAHDEPKDEASAVTSLVRRRRRHHPHHRPTGRNCCRSACSARCVRC